MAAEKGVKALPSGVSHHAVAAAYVRGDWKALRGLGLDKAEVKRLKSKRARGMNLEPSDITPSPEAIIGPALY